MQEIEELQIGQSITLTGNIGKFRQLCSRMENKFKVVKISEESFLVVRIDVNVKGLKESVIDAIKGMKIFEEVEVQGNIGYIRSIVSNFNKQRGRAVKVSKRGVVVVLTEDIRERESFTEEDVERVNEALNELSLMMASKVITQMEEELL